MYIASAVTETPLSTAHKTNVPSAWLVRHWFFGSSSFQNYRVVGKFKKLLLCYSMILRIQIQSFRNNTKFYYKRWNLLKDFEDRFSRVFSICARYCTLRKEKKWSKWKLWGEGVYKAHCDYEFLLQLAAHLATKADCIVIFLETS